MTYSNGFQIKRTLIWFLSGLDQNIQLQFCIPLKIHQSLSRENPCMSMLGDQSLSLLEVSAASS